MVINNIHDLAIHFGTSVNRLERDIYKYTDCGAWITYDSGSVTVGSIVEGSDAEFSHDFVFPFSSESFDCWLDELEALTDEAWHEANDDGWDRWEIEPSRDDWDEEV
ncbi:MAG: hypothetical protein J6S14_02170 [Clostridia bacterium]|nr:hypothetical protein [Clostridia bacterium]